MNFPLDQLFQHVYKDHPFRELAWSDWVTQGSPQFFNQYLMQEGGSGTPEVYFEQERYSEEDITGALQRNLEKFLYPSNDELDRHIQFLFAITNWFALFEAPCFQRLSSHDKGQLQEFHNPSSKEYTLPLVNVAKDLHANFALTLEGAPKDFQTMAELEDAYRAVALAELKIPPVRESSLAVHHHRYDPRVAPILMGTRDGLNPNALVVHLVQQLSRAVEFFWGMGAVGDSTAWESLVQSFDAQFGDAPRFHISQFQGTAFPPVDRLKLNRKTDAPPPTLVSAQDYNSMFYTRNILTLRDNEEGNRTVTKLFMLSGFWYRHLMVDPVEQFGRHCAKQPAPRNIGIFDQIMDRIAASDLGMFKFSNFGPEDIQLRCLQYIVTKANSIAKLSSEAHVSLTSWGAPQKVSPATAGNVLWDKPTTRRPGFSGHADEVAHVTTTVEKYPDRTILWVIGGVCLGAYVLANA